MYITGSINEPSETIILRLHNADSNLYIDSGGIQNIVMVMVKYLMGLILMKSEAIITNYDLHFENLKKYEKIQKKCNKSIIHYLQIY